MKRRPFLQRAGDALAWTFAPDSVVKRRYDAARLVSDRNARFSTFAAETPAALNQARSRERYYGESNAYVRAAHRALVTHLVGAGIVAASTHPDAATQAMLADAWGRFCNECDSDGLTNLGGLQSALTLDMIRDGEGLALMRNTSRGLRIQRLAPDQIDDAQTRDLGGGAFIQSGVEFDSEGQKVAYHLFPANPANASGMQVQSVRVSADDVLHVFEQRGAGQCRGLPWGVAAIKRVGEIDQLEDALLVGAKVGAMLAGFISDDMGAAPFPFDAETQDGSQITAALEPGTLQRLGPGQKVTFTSPQQAAQGVEFLASQVRAIASAYGVPPQFVDSDYARTNFSALKSALAVYAARLDQIVHTILRPMLLDRIWRRWVTTEILAGRIEALDFESNPDAWFGAEWFAPAPPVADDFKAAQADVLQIQNGLKSRAQAIRERGYAPEALDAERAADAQREEALGLIVPTDGEQADNEESDSNDA
ncbi:MAG: phage portal protein [Alphaproteobacteria bacterium]|nr:MAG: phage portal protein [Alphaproteobacteria bacterium]